MTTLTDGVLDMTFLNIEDEADFERGLKERIDLYHRQLEAARKKNKTGASSPTSKSSPTHTHEMTLSGMDSFPFKAVRLGNNSIDDLMIIIGPLSRKIDCSKILWLDMSFNQVERIPQKFIETFPNLRSLYLQANKIEKLGNIKKLMQLEHLRQLLLFGNPMEEKKVIYQNESLT
jgi:hypothetical protein